MARERVFCQLFVPSQNLTLLSLSSIQTNRVRRYVVGTYIIPGQHTIHELERSHHDQEEHEGVEEFDPLRCFVDIVVPYSSCDVLSIVSVAYLCGHAGRFARGSGVLCSGRGGFGRVSGCLCGCCGFSGCHCGVQSGLLYVAEGGSLCRLLFCSGGNEVNGQGDCV